MICCVIFCWQLSTFRNLSEWCFLPESITNFLKVKILPGLRRCSHFRVLSSVVFLSYRLLVKKKWQICVVPAEILCFCPFGSFDTKFLQSRLPCAPCDLPQTFEILYLSLPGTGIKGMHGHPSFQSSQTAVLPWQLPCLVAGPHCTVAIMILQNNHFLCIWGVALLLLLNLNADFTWVHREGKILSVPLDMMAALERGEP